MSNSRAPQPWLSDRPGRRGRRTVGRLLALLFATAIVGATAIWTDVAGAGQRWQSVLDRVDRFVAGPVPIRSSVPTVVVTPRPSVAVTLPPTLPPGATPGPTETPYPTPARVAVDVNIDHDPEGVFAHELKNTWCSPAGVQMVLTLHGHGATSHAFQEELAARVHEWESYDDSHNGAWGPAAMAEALAAYGVPGYVLRAYDTRADALRDAAAAIASTEAPAILLAWKGAHTWVMTGYRADADPRVFPDATVTGAYILDPWYPTISRIWGASDPPGTFQDAAEMVRNYLPWKRPEGKYPDRDGRFIALLPTLPLDPMP
ncbi:MAG: C39 family peptidase [Candidatus Limnocylindrales bacterium]